MKENSQGLNSVEIPPYGSEVKPGFIPFYEVAADLVEMENIKHDQRNREKFYQRYKNYD